MLNNLALAVGGKYLRADRLQRVGGRVSPVTGLDFDCRGVGPFEAKKGGCCAIAFEFQRARFLLQGLAQGKVLSYSSSSSSRSSSSSG